MKPVRDRQIIRLRLRVPDAAAAAWSHMRRLSKSDGAFTAAAVAMAAEVDL